MQSAKCKVQNRNHNGRKSDIHLNPEKIGGATYFFAGYGLGFQLCILHFTFYLLH